MAERLSFPEVAKTSWLLKSGEGKVDILGSAKTIQLLHCSPDLHYRVPVYTLETKENPSPSNRLILIGGPNKACSVAIILYP